MTDELTVKLTVDDLVQAWHELSNHVDDYDWYWIMRLDQDFIPDLEFHWALRHMLWDYGAGL